MTLASKKSSTISKILSMLLLAGTISTSTTANSGQQKIDQKRQKQIQQALASHGYNPGKTWEDTRAVLKQIAKEHGWQRSYVPDTRVLLMLGLTNGDPDVLTWPPSKLEPGLLAEKEARDRKAEKLAHP